MSIVPGEQELSEVQEVVNSVYCDRDIADLLRTPPRDPPSLFEGLTPIRVGPGMEEIEAPLDYAEETSHLSSGPSSSEFGSRPASSNSGSGALDSGVDSVDVLEEKDVGSICSSSQGTASIVDEGRSVPAVHPSSRSSTVDPGPVDTSASGTSVLSVAGPDCRGVPDGVHEARALRARSRRSSAEYSAICRPAPALSPLARSPSSSLMARRRSAADPGDRGDVSSDVHMDRGGAVDRPHPVNGLVVPKATSPGCDGALVLSASGSDRDSKKKHLHDIQKYCMRLQKDLSRGSHISFSEMEDDLRHLIPRPGSSGFNKSAALRGKGRSFDRRSSPARSSPARGSHRRDRPGSPSGRSHSPSRRVSTRHGSPCRRPVTPPRYRHADKSPSRRRSGRSPPRRGSTKSSSPRRGSVKSSSPRRGSTKSGSRSIRDSSRKEESSSNAAVEPYDPVLEDEHGNVRRNSGAPARSGLTAQMRTRLSDPSSGGSCSGVSSTESYSYEPMTPVDPAIIRNDFVSVDDVAYLGSVPAPPPGLALPYPTAASKLPREAVSVGLPYQRWQVFRIEYYGGSRKIICLIGRTDKTIAACPVGDFARDGLVVHQEPPRWDVAAHNLYEGDVLQRIRVGRSVSRVLLDQSRGAYDEGIIQGCRQKAKKDLGLIVESLRRTLQEAHRKYSEFVHKVESKTGSPVSEDAMLDAIKDKRKIFHRQIECIEAEIQSWDFYRDQLGEGGCNSLWAKYLPNHYYHYVWPTVPQ